MTPETDMSTSMTPETDWETMRDEYDHVDTDFGPFGPSDTVPADFARTFERERDEWRMKSIDLHKQLAAERALADRLAKDLKDLWHHHSLTGAAYEVIESALTALEEARK